MAKLIIRKGRTKPLWHGHPWIYAQVVSSRQGDAQAGDVVEVVDSQGAFIGRAFTPLAKEIRSGTTVVGVEREPVASATKSRHHLIENMTIP